MIQFLIQVNMVEEAKTLRDEARLASQAVSRRVRPLKELKYEEQHEEVLSVYPPYVPKPADNVASFDYMF